ncbi:Yip1-like protein [Rhodovulum bhavnagarense]|uniref:Yip1-like protein n=1 Tax=Rhodovulum bhavnagarense TaxID=992286 RepID=A0A4R2RLF7_9RHOB|nr:YIP1 family protein [Rhodovulum bhavnagarense]TCP63449.1 Yip1-like protein [Rhodovulum bhavnagarense]
MSVTRDIVSTWRAPRATMRKMLDAGQREDRAIVLLLLACGIIFVAQWPRLARQSFFDDSVPLQALLGGALFGWLFLAPLFFYGVAAFSHLFVRMLGGRGTWYGARLALFWTLLSTAPLWLLQGLVAGFIGAGSALNLVATLLGVAFLAIWLLSLAEAEELGRA